MKISLIAAIGPNRELGKDNKLLYRIPEDLRRFKKITQGHVVIMGRKTFESIGKPLPGRLNIIITRNPNYKIKGCVVVHSIDEALGYVLSLMEKIKHKTFKAGSLMLDKDEVFVIGGGEIYRQAIEIADKLYLTIVNSPAQADTFFPNYSEFKKKVLEEEHENNGLRYKFVELVR